MCRLDWKLFSFPKESQSHPALDVSPSTRRINRVCQILFDASGTEVKLHSLRWFCIASSEAQAVFFSFFFFLSSFYTVLSELSFKHPYSNDVPIWCEFVHNPLLTLNQKIIFWHWRRFALACLGRVGMAGMLRIFFIRFFQDTFFFTAVFACWETINSEPIFTSLSPS